MAYLMCMTSVKDQRWVPQPGLIAFANTNVFTGKTATATLAAADIDLSSAQIVWEGRNQEPSMQVAFSAVPSVLGPHWVEAEALFPDGRRIFAASEFNSVATHVVTLTPPSQISISGVQGQSFTLEASEDLVQWLELITDTFATNTYEFVDEDAIRLEERFYRAIGIP